MPSIAETRADQARAFDAPSRALIDHAGEYASAIARVFPRPHAEFFAAEGARRHLIGLIAHRARGDFAALREPLAFWSLKRLAAAYLPHAPDGLIEALRKIDAPLRGAEYERLFSVLDDSKNGAKVLRHVREIDSELIRCVDLLPAEWRRMRILALVNRVDLAGLVGRAARRISKSGIDGAALGRVGARLERARSAAQLFRMLIEEIGLERLAPPPAPGADWLKPLSTVPQINSAALRFENCLQGRIPWLLRGHGAYYEVLGAEPAIVEIVRDASGLWLVGEVRGHANCAISPALWERVRLHLNRHGAITSRRRPDGLAIALVQAAGW